MRIFFLLSHIWKLNNSVVLSLMQKSVSESAGKSNEISLWNGFQVDLVLDIFCSCLSMRVLVTYLLGLLDLVKLVVYIQMSRWNCMNFIMFSVDIAQNVTPALSGKRSCNFHGCRRRSDCLYLMARTLHEWLRWRCVIADSFNNGSELTSNARCEVHAIVLEAWGRSVLQKGPSPLGSNEVYLYLIVHVWFQ